MEIKVWLFIKPIFILAFDSELSVKSGSKAKVVRPRPAVNTKQYQNFMKKTNLSHTDSTSQTLTQPVVYSTSVIITSTSKQMSSDRGRVGKWPKLKFYLKTCVKYKYFK